MNKCVLLAGLLGLLLLAGCETGPRRVNGLVTTTPVTQDRDHATYNWQSRHAEILARNQTVKPDVVFIGDSIIHFWGGAPKAPRVWGGEAWTNCFAGFKVTNLGFGWDRTENVLWRLDHGELDGIKPKVIIIKIGTNNTSAKNSPEDIAAGIEAVCATAHKKVPAAKILLLGILPRRDEIPGHSATNPVNQLLHDRLGDVDYLTYCDFGAAFRRADGTPNPALYRDGVHVNAVGYAILGAKIREQLLALTR
jgi:lysophospholipase L1-like esterase